MSTGELDVELVPVLLDFDSNPPDLIDGSELGIDFFTGDGFFLSAELHVSLSTLLDGFEPIADDELDEEDDEEEEDTFSPTISPFPTPSPTPFPSTSNSPTSA